MTFWDHIDELRTRLLKVIFSLVIFSSLAYIYSDSILSLLLYPLDSIKLSNNIQVISVTSLFFIKISTSIMSGILISIPILLYQMLSFIYPLFPIKKMSLFFVYMLSVLFSLLGILFTYFIIIPNSLFFFTSIINNDIHINYNFTLDGYISYISWLILGGCILFQLPIITITGSIIGIFTPDFLKQYRRSSLIFFMIISAIITPPDPVSQLFIFLPLAVLYEFSILVSYIIKKSYER